jgi:branched-chain amino acid transport system ATP-binding protein
MKGVDMLDVQHLNAYYGEAQALFDVSFSVPTGSLVLIHGLNGAGKSTLMKSIIGLMPKVEGHIVWQGQALMNLPPYRRSELGLGYVPEDRRIFTALTVRQNLEIAAPMGKLRNTSQKASVNVQDILDLFPALAGMLERPAAQMSGGEQQMLALARTLMTQAKMLLLDEPCEGIAPVLVQSIANALARLKQDGYTLLIAEQNRTLKPLADQILNLAGGALSSPDPSLALSEP